MCADTETTFFFVLESHNLQSTLNFIVRCSHKSSCGYEKKKFKSCEREKEMTIEIFGYFMSDSAFYVPVFGEEFVDIKYSECRINEVHLFACVSLVIFLWFNFYLIKIAF